MPCTEESALHKERGLLLLAIGRLEESLKKFDVPAVNDAVLKDASDIEHFDERKPLIRPPRRSSHVRRSSCDGLRRSALCGAAQRRHVQPTRRARVASAQFRAIRLSCKRSAAAAKSQTRSRTADRFLSFFRGIDCFESAFEASYTGYPSCTLLTAPSINFFLRPAPEFYFPRKRESRLGLLCVL